MTSRESVKEMLEKGISQKKIASLLHISEARVSQLKAALKLPFKLRPLKPLKLKSIPHYIKDKPIRIHALGIKQALAVPQKETQLEAALAAAGYSYSREKPAAGEEAALYWSSKVENTYFYFFAYNGLMARLTTQSLTAWVDEKDAGSSEPELKLAEEAARQQLREARQALAAMLKLSLNPVEEVDTEHIAFVDDYFAAKWKREGGKFISIPDRHDKKERRRIDVSIPGHPEYEFTHRKHSKDDALAYEKFRDGEGLAFDADVEKITDGVWNIDKQLELNAKQLELNQQSIERQQVEERFFHLHNKLIEVLIAKEIATMPLKDRKDYLKKVGDIRQQRLML